MIKLPPEQEDYSSFFDEKILSLDGVFFSAAGDIVIPVKHFGMFPWDRANFLDSNITSVSSGGAPLQSYEWTFNFFVMNEKGKHHPFLVQYRWMIPDSLARARSLWESNGAECVCSKIRSILGVAKHG